MQRASERASEQAPFLGAFSDVVFFLSERAASDASQELKIIPPFAASPQTLGWAMDQPTWPNLR